MKRSVATVFHHIFTARVLLLLTSEVRLYPTSQTTEVFHQNQFDPSCSYTVRECVDSAERASITHRVTQPEWFKISLPAGRFMLDGLLTTAAQRQMSRTQCGQDAYTHFSPVCSSAKTKKRQSSWRCFYCVPAVHLFSLSHTHTEWGSCCSATVLTETSHKSVKPITPLNICWNHTHTYRNTVHTLFGSAVLQNLAQ